MSSWWLNCTCVPGYTGPDGSACTACNAGTYKTDGGSADCTACPVKSFCPQAAITPTPCPLVNSSSPSGSSAVAQCQCVPGYFGAQCGLCGSTQYCPGGATAYTCPNNGYTVAPAVSAADCTCPANAAPNGSSVCQLDVIDQPKYPLNE
jgi:hypothetical protein